MKRASKKPATAKQPAVPQPLSLKDAQALFQEAILTGDQRILASLCDNSKTTRDTLFGVYQNGYVGRLVEILANDYEHLAAVMGEDAFDEAARSYIAAHPSQSQNARWFGNGFPEFLRVFDQTADRAEFADLANLERALGDAFDAADCDPLTLAGLAAFPPEAWGQLVFRPHPSARLITCSTNAFGLWQAIADEQPPPSVTAAEQRLIVWRSGTMPMVREMAAEEAMMWTEANRGLRFDALCEMVATFDNPDEAAMRAARYLQGWLSAGLLASANLSD